MGQILPARQDASDPSHLLAGQTPDVDFAQHLNQSSHDLSLESTHLNATQLFSGLNFTDHLLPKTPFSQTCCCIAAAVTVLTRPKFKRLLAIHEGGSGASFRPSFCRRHMQAIAAGWVSVWGDSSKSGRSPRSAAHPAEITGISSLHGMMLDTSCMHLCYCERVQGVVEQFVQAIAAVGWACSPPRWPPRSNSYHEHGSCSSSRHVETCEVRLPAALASRRSPLAWQPRQTCRAVCCARWRYLLTRASEATHTCSPNSSTHVFLLSGALAEPWSRAMGRPARLSAVHAEVAVDLCPRGPRQRSKASCVVGFRLDAPPLAPSSSWPVACTCSSNL